MTPRQWQGLRYPDSDLVGLIHRFARPGRDVPAEGALAVDAACGPGRHVRLLEELGYQALGFDCDPEMCRIARANGISVVQADIPSFTPPRPPDLVVAWGLMMLVEDGPALVASWQPAIVIANWRTPENTFFSFPENIRLPNGAVRIVRPDHTLHNQIYFAHQLSECQIPGYSRVFHQQVTKTFDGEHHAWFQTVHRRLTARG